MENEDLEDMFRAFGHVSIRKMFGGKGIYVDGRIVAVMLRGDLLIKGDATSAPEIEADGGVRWAYTHNKTGKDVQMPYWTLPEIALDDDDERRRFARLAVDASIRAEK